MLHIHALMFIIFCFLPFSNNSIYGIRWSLGNYYSYHNLYKIHAQSNKPPPSPQSYNYYILSFNSETVIEQQVYLQIDETVHGCAVHFITVPYSNDHIQIELFPNTKVNSTDFYVYRCYVNHEITGQVNNTNRNANNISNSTNTTLYPHVPYTIYTREFQYPPYNHSENSTFININITLNKKILYNNTFRVPAQQSFSKQESLLSKNILVLGDWSIIDGNPPKYIPIKESILKQISSNQNIIMTIFLGDLAYDIVGQKYRLMLEYIQPITSVMVFMTTPGNHDYLYHQDSFRLYVETFMNPNWQTSYNLYYSFVLGDVLFISYMPDDIIKGKKISRGGLQFMQQELFNNYVKRLGEGEVGMVGKQGANFGTIDPIYKQYHVIVFSHYPIFCSKMNDDLQSCQQNPNKLQDYLNIFTDIGMDIYISGHLHYYERSNSICWNKYNKTITQKKRQNTLNINSIPTDIYNPHDDTCSMYIVEGVGGNNYFEEAQGAIKPAQFTAKVYEGTGYGIMGIVNGNDGDQIYYTHYRMKNEKESVAVDSVVQKLKKLSKGRVNEENGKILQNKYEIDIIFLRVFEVSIVALLTIVSIIYFYKLRKSKITAKTNRQDKLNKHFQMVEEAFETVKENTYTGKGTGTGTGTDVGFGLGSTVVENQPTKKQAEDSES